MGCSRKINPYVKDSLRLAISFSSLTPTGLKSDCPSVIEYWSFLTHNCNNESMPQYIFSTFRDPEQTCFQFHILEIQTQ